MAIRSSRSNPPYFLTQTDQTPEPLSGLIKGNLPAEEKVLGVFVVPPDVHAPQGFRRRANPLQSLVFTQNGVLHVSAPEPRKKAGSATWILARDIIKIKLTLILLYGKLEIWGIHNGKLSTIELEYNTIAHKLLAPRVKEVIQKTWDNNPPWVTPPVEDASFSDFINTSFSFFNGIMGEAIQPGEFVLNYLYQPELRDTWLKIFHRKVFPKTLLVATNHQVILLQEDLRLKTHHEWVFTFIPRYRISHIDDEEIEKSRLRVKIRLRPLTILADLELLLDSENSLRWNTIVSTTILNILV